MLVFLPFLVGQPVRELPVLFVSRYSGTFRNIVVPTTVKTFERSGRWFLWACSPSASPFVFSVVVVVLISASSPIVFVRVIALPVPVSVSLSSVPPVSLPSCQAEAELMGLLKGGGHSLQKFVKMFDFPACLFALLCPLFQDAQNRSFYWFWLELIY